LFCNYTYTHNIFTKTCLCCTVYAGICLLLTQILCGSYNPQRAAQLAMLETKLAQEKEGNASLHQILRATQTSLSESRNDVELFQVPTSTTHALLHIHTYTHTHIPAQIFPCLGGALLLGLSSGSPPLCPLLPPSLIAHPHIRNLSQEHNRSVELRVRSRLVLQTVSRNSGHTP